jgi:hypothetical protein
MTTHTEERERELDLQAFGNCDLKTVVDWANWWKLIQNDTGILINHGENARERRPSDPAQTPSSFFFLPQIQAPPLSHLSACFQGFRVRVRVRLRTGRVDYWV